MLLPRLFCAVSLALLASHAPVRAQPVSSHDVFTGRVVDGEQMQVGRYTTTLAKPAQAAASPLDVYIQITYPRQTVQTVGDAVRHTLQRTGWRLVEPSALAPDASRFLTFPLPESQRTLGPYRAREVLQVLLGDTWVWHEDPVRRLVWFTVAPRLTVLTPEPAASTPVAEQITPPVPTTTGAAASVATEGTSK